jgi:hypothetical protein
MRRRRWIVEQFRYTDENCDYQVPYYFRFRTKVEALEHWQREKDHCRLFLSAGLYLQLPGGRRKTVQLFCNDKDMLASLKRFFDDLRSRAYFKDQEELIF